MSFGHLSRPGPAPGQHPHTGFAKRMVDALRLGEFIPSRHGSLSFGYDLWARHANGDVIVHCGGNAGWFDWFTPVQPGDVPDFELTIEGTPYRLVRGVDKIPAAFVSIHAAAAERQNGNLAGEREKGARAPIGLGSRRVGRPSKAPEAVGPTPEPPAWERRRYLLEVCIDETWTHVDRFGTEWAASSAGRERAAARQLRHRLVYRDEVLREWP